MLIPGAKLNILTTQAHHASRYNSLEGIHPWFSVVKQRAWHLQSKCAEVIIGSETITQLMKLYNQILWRKRIPQSWKVAQDLKTILLHKKIINKSDSMSLSCVQNIQKDSSKLNQCMHQSMHQSMQLLQPDLHAINKLIEKSHICAQVSSTMRKPLIS